MKQNGEKHPHAKERIPAGILFCIALFLIGYCIFHQMTDHVHYEWTLSPYLFPLIIASILLFLSSTLLFRKGGK